MDDLVNSLTDKIYEEVQINILKESFNVVINAISKAMKNKNFELDKECTVKRLNKTIEVIYNKLLEQNDEIITPDLIKKVKIKTFDSKSDIGQVFCKTKNSNKNDIENVENIGIKKENKICVFSKEIPNTIEIPKNIF
ncbi:hypothetical protein BCR32DRAFT_325266, partial [Anaeromyces robustus]